MVRKEDLGLTLSLSNCGENRLPLQLNIMPPSASSSSSCPSSFILQKSNWCGTVSSSEIFRGETRTLLRGIDVNRMPSTVDCEEEVGVSSPNSTVSSVSGKRCERETNGEEVNEIERVCSGGVSDEEDVDICRKKLRLSKDQSAILEESFKEHNTLNPKQKLTLAKQLNLRPRQVEVWFQNRRARTKLKQTEVDCEFLKRCCENLTEQNRRLKKEVQELRALKLSPPIYMQMTPPTTLTTCPSCDRVAVSTSSTGATTTVAGDAQHRHLSGTHLHRPLPFNPWVAAAALNHRPFDAPPSRS